MNDTGKSQPNNILRKITGLAKLASLKGGSARNFGNGNAPFVPIVGNVVVVVADNWPLFRRLARLGSRRWGDFMAEIADSGDSSAKNGCQ